MARWQGVSLRLHNGRPGVHLIANEEHQDCYEAPVPEGDAEAAASLLNARLEDDGLAEIRVAVRGGALIVESA